MISISKPCFNKPKTRKTSTGDWNFIEALTNPSYKLRDQPEQVYMHPHAKRSSSLSTTSLDTCTECLGSETGNDIDPNAEEFPVFEIKRPNRITKPKKSMQTNSFPPPLPSIGGIDGVQVKTRREGGRLTIKAYSDFPSCVSCFEADRENGRLRLCFMKDDMHELYGNEVEEQEMGGMVGDRRGGGERLSSSRCNGDGNGNKRLQSLQICVAIS